MNLKVMLDEGAYMPERAHAADAGYDLRTPVDVHIAPQRWATVKTGVHVQIPEGYVGMLKTKSGINLKKCVTGEGVIDSGYTGSIKVKLYNHSLIDQDFKAGDKIIQLVILPILTPELEEVDSFPDTERGSNGFGSSGR